MAGAGLARADRHAQASSEDGTNGGQLAAVAHWRGGRMGIDMLHLARRNIGLAQRLLHGPASTVTVLRAGGEVIGIGTGAVTDQFRQRLRAAGHCMLQGLDYQQAGPLGHDETIAVAVERPRGLLGLIVETSGQRTRRGEAAEGDAMDRRLGSAAQGNVRFAAANQSGRIADGLCAGRAGSYRCAERPLEAVPDRHMPGRHIGEKRRRGEWRESARPTLVRGAHGLGDGTEASDAGGDDGRGALPLRLVCRMPGRLRQGFLGGSEGKLDKAIHLLAFLGRDESLRVITRLRIFRQAGYPPAYGAAGTVGKLGWQRTNTGLPRQQTRPDRLAAAAPPTDPAGSP